MTGGLRFPRAPRSWVALLAALLAGAFSADAQEPKFIFDTGEPAWGGERIQLPPTFAPDMKWNGVEDIRFAPGMFQADSDSFFTYALVFLLEKDSDVSLETVQRELLTYYRGLCQAVIKGKGKEVDPATFAIALVKEESPKSLPAKVESVTQFGGTLDWIEPFATQAKQQLHFEIQVWTHAGQPALFLCVSPQKRDARIWDGLRQIRSTFRIESGQ